LYNILYDFLSKHPHTDICMYVSDLLIPIYSLGVKLEHHEKTQLNT